MESSSRPFKTTSSPHEWVLRHLRTDLSLSHRGFLPSSAVWITIAKFVQHLLFQARYLVSLYFWAKLRYGQRLSFAPQGLLYSHPYQMATLAPASCLHKKTEIIAEFGIHDKCLLLFFLRFFLSLFHHQHHNHDHNHHYYFITIWLFWDRVSLCFLGWPETYSID